jgi:hypothetical protein
MRGWRVKVSVVELFNFEADPAKPVGGGYTMHTALEHHKVFNLKKPRERSISVLKASVNDIVANHDRHNPDRPPYR